MSVRSSPALWLAGVLVAGIVLRIAACVVLSGNLSDDRDIYLALADGLAEGRGYSVPGSTEPTAFRPPLYPLVLALPGLRSPAGVAGLNIVLGIAAVLLTHSLARALGLPASRAVIAAALVAVDPLLINYATQPMTEVLCACLLTGLLFAISFPPDSSIGWTRPAVIGVLFGLAALCRPTVWACGALIAGWWCLRLVMAGSLQAKSVRVARAGIVVATVCVIVSPWVLRNALAMGRPIVTTTHGGYTLLLGNNPSFYREVVEQPLGTVWDGSHGPGQEAWAAAINAELDGLGLRSEVARDQWMSEAAWSWIINEPVSFLRACLLRFIRFWNVVPTGPAGDVPGPVTAAVAAYYVLVLGAALVGLGTALRTDAVRWTPLLLLIASFCIVHLFYWSNARMRAPVMPAVAVLAAGALLRRGDSPLSPAQSSMPPLN